MHMRAKQESHLVPATKRRWQLRAYGICPRPHSKVPPTGPRPSLFGGDQ